MKHLIEERVKLHEQNKAILDAAEKDKRSITAEENTQIAAREARMAEIRASLDTAARVNEEERALSESAGRRTTSTLTEVHEGPSADDQALAFRGWCLGRQASPEMISAAQRCGVNLHQAEISMAPRVVRNSAGVSEVRYIPVGTNSVGDITESRSAMDARARAAVEGRALSVGTTTAGGNSVPNEVMRAYYEVMKWYARIEDEATAVNTETGATLPWPTISDTANTGRILGEATTATTTTDPTFGIVNLGAYKFSSDAVLISWELLQDSFIDLASYLGRALGTRIGRIRNTKFTVGAGTTEPKGLITGSTTSAAAATNAFTLDEVITLIHAVDKAYRGLPGTGFTVHDTIAAYLRKFKDSTGRYMWEISNQVGQPDRLFGYPVSINNDMDSALTTGKKLLAFGNTKLALLVRNAGAVRLVRDDSKYVLEHQILFEASQRGDSNVVDATASKVLTLA